MSGSHRRLMPQILRCVRIEQYTHPQWGAQFGVCVNVNRGCTTPTGGVNNSLHINGERVVLWWRRAVLSCYSGTRNLLMLCRHSVEPIPPPNTYTGYLSSTELHLSYVCSMLMHLIHIGRAPRYMAHTLCSQSWNPAVDPV